MLGQSKGNVKLKVFITIPTDLLGIVLVLVMGNLFVWLPITNCCLYIVPTRSQQIHGYFFTADLYRPQAF